MLHDACDEKTARNILIYEVRKYEKNMEHQGTLNMLYCGVYQQKLKEQFIGLTWLMRF